MSRNDRLEAERKEAIQSIYDSSRRFTSRAALNAETALKKFYNLAKERRKLWIEERKSDDSVRWVETWVDDWWGDTEWIKAWIKAWKAANLALNEWCHAASSEGVARKEADPGGRGYNLKEPWPIFAAEEARNQHANDPVWVSARVAKERADREWSIAYMRMSDNLRMSQEYGVILPCLGEG